MFIAELSALDIGSYVTVTGIPKGNKYTITNTGIVTEIKHNTVSGHTALRVHYKPWNLTKEAQDEMIAEVQGYIKSWPFGTAVTIHEPPL